MGRGRRMSCKDMTETVRRSIDGVAKWVEAHNYRAFDPGDGDLSFLRYHFRYPLFAATFDRGRSAYPVSYQTLDRNQATHLDQGHGIHGVGVCKDVRDHPV